MKRHLIIVILICFASLSGCSNAELSRKQAATDIEKSKEIQERRLRIELHSTAANKMADQGFLSEKELPSVISGVGGDFKLFQLNQPGDIIIEVTGIADSTKGENIKEAQFVWRYSDLPSVVRRFAVEGGTGNAVYRLFDDGWRLESVSTGSSGIPIALSAEEQAAETADVQAEAAYREREKARLAELIKSSRTPKVNLLKRKTQTRASFLLQEISITDVDISFFSFICIGRNPDCRKLNKVWFGDLVEVGDTWSRREEVAIRVRNKGWRPIAVGSTDESVEIENIIISALKAWKSAYSEVPL